MKASLDVWLREIMRQSYYGIPKSRYTHDEVVDMFGISAINGDSVYWFIPYRHQIFSGANDDDITQTEQSLKITLPLELKELLQISDGIWLYMLNLSWFTHGPYIKYRIFSSSELARVNHELLDNFRQMLGEDPDFREISMLNYIAFCDAHDGNYLAIILDGMKQGYIFFLDHEYLFRPYSERDADLYYTVAPSLEEWLRILAHTYGWGGFDSYEDELSCDSNDGA